MELAFLYGQPCASGHLKAEFRDFIVIEELGYPLSGEGEFIALRVRKTNANTLFVGEKLAEFVGISPRQMSYAGLKDRHAITEQWFCLHLPGKEIPDFSTFICEGVEILEITRHSRKIRVGSLAGNHFTLCLRDVTENAELHTRLQQIAQFGFPNYFTEQRFGRDGHNLTQALRWANGEIKVKDRKKRSFYLSAARSEIFNLVVSERIKQGNIREVLPQDYLQLYPSNSFFIAQAQELADLQPRLESGDICLTAPLVGEKALEKEANTQEREIIQRHHALISLMKQEKVADARRPMLTKPQDLQWHFSEEGLHLSFYLDAGSYATALVRELIQINEQT